MPQPKFNPHEPRSHRGLLHAEPPAQGGILAPGGPSSGPIDPHPDAVKRKRKRKPAAKRTRTRSPKATE
jgi:hypothetical protein